MGFKTMIRHWLILIFIPSIAPMHRLTNKGPNLENMDNFVQEIDLHPSRNFRFGDQVDSKDIEDTEYFDYQEPQKKKQNENIKNKENLSEKKKAKVKGEALIGQSKFKEKEIHQNENLEPEVLLNGRFQEEIDKNHMDRGKIINNIHKKVSKKEINKNLGKSQSNRTASVKETPKQSLLDGMKIEDALIRQAEFKENKIHQNDNLEPKVSSKQRFQEEIEKDRMDRGKIVNNIHKKVSMKEVDKNQGKTQSNRTTNVKENPRQSLLDGIEMANKIIEHANNSRVGNIRKESRSDKKGKKVKDGNILKDIKHDLKSRKVNKNIRGIIDTLKKLTTGNMTKSKDISSKKNPKVSKENETKKGQKRENSHDKMSTEPSTKSANDKSNSATANFTSVTKRDLDHLSYRDGFIEDAIRAVRNDLKDYEISHNLIDNLDSGKKYRNLDRAMAKIQHRLNETDQTSSFRSGKLKTMENSSKLPNVTGNPEITKATKLAVNNKTSIAGESLRDNATLSSHATQLFSTTTDLYKNITKQTSKLPNVTENPEITKAPKLAVNNKTSVIGESLRDNATLSSHATQSFSTTTDLYKNITKQTSKLPNVSGTPEQTKAPFLAVTNKTTKIGRNRQLRNFEDPKNLQSKSCGPSDGDKAAGSGDWRKEGLKIHNAYRKDHEAQPLQLDEKLNKRAQEWADELVQIRASRHSRARKGKQWGKYGENIASGSGGCFGSSEIDAVRKSVEKWYKELTHCGEGWTGCGHFTQLVWKGSKKLGLGVAQDRSGKRYVVAQYDPVGNMEGKYEENVEIQPSSKASGYSLGDSSKSGPESRNRDKGKVVKANENTPSKLNVTTPTSRTFNASIIPNPTTTPKRTTTRKVTTTKKSNAGQHKIWTFSIFFHTIVPCVLAKKLFF